MVHIIQNRFQDYLFTEKGKMKVDMLVCWENGGFLIIIIKKKITAAVIYLSSKPLGTFTVHTDLL